MSTTSVAHQPGRMADLLATTAPLPSVPRGRHRVARARVDVELYLTSLGLGALLAGFVYLTGGPW